MPKGKKWEEFYARNESRGRTARFDMTLDFTRIPNEERVSLKLPAVEVKIRRGTLTPEQARRIWDILTEDRALLTEGVPNAADTQPVES